MILWIGLAISNIIFLIWIYQKIKYISYYFQYLEKTINNLTGENPEIPFSLTLPFEFTFLGQKIDTGLKKLQKKLFELKEQNNKLAIFNYMEEGVIAQDEKGKIIFINTSIEKIFGIHTNEIIGKSSIEVIRNYELNNILKKTGETNITSSVELNMVSPIERIFAVHCVPIKESSTRNLGVIAVLYDITEIRKLERLKTEFVANVSHELRTPLTSIKGFVETLQEGAIDDKEYNQKFLSIINKHVLRLEKLVQNLLKLAKVESDKSDIKMENINLPELINEAWDILKKEAIKQNILLELQDDKNCSWIIADKDYLIEVFINILENAIKFNKINGKIIIKTTLLSDKVKVEITDTGVGISNDDLQRLGQRFYRVDKSRSIDSGGAGLGLSIVKHILKLHETNLQIESKEGLGTTISFCLQNKKI